MPLETAIVIKITRSSFTNIQSNNAEFVQKEADRSKGSRAHLNTEVDIYLLRDDASTPMPSSWPQSTTSFFYCLHDPEHKCFLFYPSNHITQPMIMKIGWLAEFVEARETVLEKYVVSICWGEGNHTE